MPTRAEVGLAVVDVDTGHSKCEVGEPSAEQVSPGRGIAAGEHQADRQKGTGDKQGRALYLGVVVIIASPCAPQIPLATRGEFGGASAPRYRLPSDVAVGRIAAVMAAVTGVAMAVTTRTGLGL